MQPSVDLKGFQSLERSMNESVVVGTDLITSTNEFVRAVPEVDDILSGLCIRLGHLSLR